MCIDCCIDCSRYPDYPENSPDKGKLVPNIGPTGQALIPYTTEQAMEELDLMLIASFKAEILAYPDGYEFAQDNREKLGHWLKKNWALGRHQRLVSNLFEHVGWEDDRVRLDTISGFILELYYKHLMQHVYPGQLDSLYCASCGAVTPESRQACVVVDSSALNRERLCDSCLNEKYLSGPVPMLLQMLDSAERQHEKAIRRVVAAIERECAQVTPEDFDELMGERCMAKLLASDTSDREKQKLINKHFAKANEFKAFADRKAAMAVRGPDPMQETLDEIRLYMKEHELGPRVRRLWLSDEYSPSYSAKRYDLCSVNVDRTLALLNVQIMKVKRQLNLPKLVGYYRRAALKRFVPGARC